MRTHPGTEARYRACRATHAVDLDDEVLIWDARAEQLHRLNPTAARIWRELSSWRTTTEVATVMIADADADADGSRVASDVERCVADLAEAGLLEQQDAR